MPLRVIELRQLSQILSMFLIVQFLGLALVIPYYSGQIIGQLTAMQVASSPADALFFVLYIVVLSALMLLIFKVFNGATLLRIFEGVMIVVASFVLFSLIIGIAIGNPQYVFTGTGAGYADFIAPLLVGIAIVVAKNRLPRLKNAVTVMISVGIGLALGLSFGFWFTFFFMVALAVYDFIAVFITKHMVTMANIAVENNLSFMIMVRETKAVPMSYLTGKEQSEYSKIKGKMMKQGGIVSRLARENMALVPAMTGLGNGDLAAPLMMAAAAYKLSLNFVLSIFIVLGSALGLLLNMLVLRKYKRVLPAIPLLLAGICISMGLYYALFVIH